MDDDLLKETNLDLFKLLINKGFKPPEFPEFFTQNYAIELNKFFQHCVAPQLNKGYPSGNWYMITVTSKKGDGRSDMMQTHERFCDYMETRGQVVHACLEKSSIWHIHYVCNVKSHCVKNLQRTLNRHLGVVVDVARKVTSLKKFNGMCKYVLKREYEVKGATHEATLIDGIKYVEKEGYVISQPQEPSL